MGNHLPLSTSYSGSQRYDKSAELGAVIRSFVRSKGNFSPQGSIVADLALREKYFDEIRRIHPSKLVRVTEHGRNQSDNYNLHSRQQKKEQAEKN